MSPSPNPSLNYIGKVSSPFKVTHAQFQDEDIDIVDIVGVIALSQSPMDAELGVWGVLMMKMKRWVDVKTLKYYPYVIFFLALSPQIRLLLNAW